MKKTLAAILAVLLLAGCFGAALADSVIRPYETPTWVRTGPGLDYKIVDKIYVGNIYPWAGSIRTDNRGVDWFDVYYTDSHGVESYGWVSSLQADKLGGYNPIAEPEPDPEPASPGRASAIHPYEQPTWVRTGPGLDYKIVDKVYVGLSYQWGGSVRTDDRGVDWYDVYYTDSHGVDSYGWVSSLQADLY